MDLKKKKYESFDVVDLVLHDEFCRLVLEEGKKALEDLIEDHPESKNNILLASKIVLGIQKNKQAQSLPKKYDLWMRIRNTHRRKKNFRFYRYAAVLLLTLAIGGGALYLGTREPAILEFVQTNPPDFNQSRLVLTDGKNIVLSDNEVQVEYSRDGQPIILNDSTRYNQSHEGLNQLVVPYGKRSQIFLSDETKVILNSGSRLIYPPQFKGEEREVYLEGEAFFEVAKNPDRPFFVRTGKFKVEVIGTTFNIQAYERENLYNTVLIEGKVKLTPNNRLISNAIVMTPNQIVSLTDDHYHVAKVENMKNHTSWIDGYLEFRNENVYVLIKRISSYYNIKINMEGKVSQTLINGKLDLKDDPERIIDGIAAIVKMKYNKIEDNSYIMY
ncbi:MAG: FecR family protein [Mangrovibacterium sp.]